MLPRNTNADGSPKPSSPRPSSAPTARAAPKDENKMGSNEAQPQNLSSAHQAAPKTDEEAALERQAAVLVRKLQHSAAELQKRAQPASIHELLPVIELHRKVARLVRPPNSAERHKWESVLDTLGRSRSAHEEMRNLDREDRVDCVKMKDEMAYIRRRCLRYCKWYDKVQEQANALFGDDEDIIEDEDEDEDELTSEELYDFMRGSMGEQEQQLEEVLDEVTDVLQGIEDRMAWLDGQEEKTMGVIRGLSRMERMVVDILFSFDCWFGEELGGGGSEDGSATSSRR